MKTIKMNVVRDANGGMVFSQRDRGEDINLEELRLANKKEKVLPRLEKNQKDPEELTQVVGEKETLHHPVKIRVKNFNFYYDVVHALKNISMEIKENAVVGIIGPSGCGKSTLLRCLNGLELFDSGRVRIGEITLDRDNGLSHRDFNARLRRLREEVGMVFQSFNLFPHLTALENAMLAPMVVKKVDRRRAESTARDLLAKVGLSDRLDYYPSQLSGGQQQRAAIARALAMDPKVMLYDEPTSALDPSLVGEVLNIMRKLDDEGMTQVVVTHEMRFAREVADKILMLSAGELIESGSSDLIFSSPRDERTRTFLQRYL
jgi:polar amino acid transport system ATP-binding protein